MYDDDDESEWSQSLVSNFKIETKNYASVNQRWVEFLISDSDSTLVPTNSTPIPV